MLRRIARRVGSALSRKPATKAPAPAAKAPDALALPLDWGDPGAWDRYWEAHIAAPPFGARPSGRTDETLRGIYPVNAPMLRAWGIHRVLFAGNGVSQWPRALAYAGFEAVALDVSRVAIEHMERTPATDEELEGFLWVPSDRSAFSLVEQRREGGSCALVTGDLFDPAVTPGPFDCVVCVGVLQGLRAPAALERAVLALDARVAPGGSLLVVVWDDPKTARAIESLCLARGYFVAPAEEGEGRKRLLLRQASG